MRRIYMTNFSKKQSLLVVAAVSVLMIPGCSLFNKNNSSVMSDQNDMEQMDDSANDDSRAIVTIAGKPAITQARLEREKRDLIESNPQVKAMIAMMPAAQLDRNLTEGLTNQEIIAFYIKDKGLDQTPAYKAEMSKTLRSVKQMINTKIFTEMVPVTVTDKDVRDFYDANKDVMPQLLLSRGGVAAKGVSFSKESDAQAFFDKVNTLGGDLDKAAQEMNMADKINDFKLVNDQSMGIDSQLREKIVNMNVCPAVELITLKDSIFWVVRATHKEQTQYREFEPIKNELRTYLEQQQRAKVIEQEIVRLRKEYNVVVDESYFGDAEPMNQDTMDEMSMKDMGLDDDMDMNQEPEQEAHNRSQESARIASAA